MKICFKCLIKKPLSSFYKHPQMADGHLGKCKDCAKADVLLHRQNNIEEVRKYDRTRGRTEKRRQLNKIIRINLSAKEKAINALRRQKWAKENTIKRAAHIIVGNAIKNGNLIPCPCERCGNKKVDAHHEDYTKALSVNWLCHNCHGKRHQEINDERRAKQRENTGYIKS